MKNFIDGLSNTQVIYYGAFLGYLETAIFLFIGMALQPAALQLAAVLFVPFALSTFLIEKWYAPKILSATSLSKTRWQATFAATLAALLTGLLAGTAAAFENIFISGSGNISGNLVQIAMYVFAGFLYSIFGILTGGYVIGTILHNRRAQRLNNV